AVMVGAKFVMPGPHLDPASLVDLFHTERVTLTGGVPTIWMGVLQYLDANPGKFDLSSICALRLGGPAGADRGVRKAIRPADHPGLGDDRDGAARHRGALPAVDGGRERRGEVRVPRHAGAAGALCRHSRAPPKQPRP